MLINDILITNLQNSMTDKYNSKIKALEELLSEMTDDEVIFMIFHLLKLYFTIILQEENKIPDSKEIKLSTPSISEDEIQLIKIDESTAEIIQSIEANLDEYKQQMIQHNSCHSKLKEISFYSFCDPNHNSRIEQSIVVLKTFVKEFLPDLKSYYHYNDMTLECSHLKNILI